MSRTFITVPSAFDADLAATYELEGKQLVDIPYELYQTPPTSSIDAVTAGAWQVPERIH
jgi:hypothetical protein